MKILKDETYNNMLREIELLKNRKDVLEFRNSQLRRDVSKLGLLILALSGLLLVKKQAEKQLKKYRPFQ